MAYHPQPYHIHLLNELHHWFPEVLYNPQRFQNVQDLLGYIVQIATQGAYHTANTEYQQTRQYYANPNNQYAHAPLTPPQNVGHMFAIHNDNDMGSDTSFNINNSIFIQRVRPINSSSVPSVSSASSSISTTLMSGIIDQLLGDVTPLSAINSFLNQNVIVRPTLDQITNNTTVTAADCLQDDNCAICQDEIEEDQSMRQINHCRHRFHQDCIDVWFQSNVRCPTCRHDIRE